jgi:aldehyde dehydrogenase (NAD+)
LTSVNETVEALENLEKWSAPEKVSGSPLLNAFDTCLIRSDPLGVVLIIAPWNYPFALTIHPLIAVLAAGNAAILKPSEISPAISHVFAHELPRYLDSEAIQVVTGAIPETTALLKEKFDYIFYTGKAPDFLLPVPTK